ncbi:spore coat protein U domain-containing protein [Phyllobacterium sp. 628]|uniref:Csu type fimbrial protein n=1 Tax=Phyllobacterium sp. 628 TaxID=2718938 RepID=UPI00166228A3|nr:spore coat U domain-containing protein [Phyllobacterium sp. 628]QND52799.1 spore coat protein U domain-containing protein [Phyllobacterium sp. 628]
MKINFAILATVSVVATGVSSNVNAGSSTGNLEVKIVITKECQVNVGSGGTVSNAVLDFGSKGVLNKAVDGETAAKGTGSIQVQCTNGTALKIGLGAGTNASTANDVNTRRMKSGTEFISYQLYQDTAHKSVWGNTTDTASNVVSLTADGTIQSKQIFGQIPAQTTPADGTYTDTVVVSVSY